MNTNSSSISYRPRRPGASPRRRNMHYVSQTAVTQQVHLLEETLGCRLFDRTTRPGLSDPGGPDVSH